MQNLHWSHTHTSDGFYAPTPLFDLVSASETFVRYFKLRYVTLSIKVVAVFYCHMCWSVINSVLLTAMN